MGDYAYAEDAQAATTQIHTASLYGNQALANLVNQGAAPYQMSRPAAHPVVRASGSDRMGAGLGTATATGLTIFGTFLPWWQVGVGAAVVAVGGYMLFGKKSRRR